MPGGQQMNDDKPEDKEETRELDLAELRIEWLMMQLADAEKEIESLRRENGRLRVLVQDIKP